MARVMPSEYWLEELPRIAKSLSLARQEGDPGTIAAMESVYRHAFQRYTNPFNVNKGTQEGP